ERQDHKVDFDVMWQDYLKKEKCEVIVDILDLRISKISKLCNLKINKEIYDIIQTMQVFGVHSH
ncbi:9082_t:CDS:2, partial [Racocetra persica]